MSVLAELREVFKGTILCVDLDKEQSEITEHVNLNAYFFKISVKNMNKLQHVDFSISEKLKSEITEVGVKAGFNDIVWDVKFKNFVFSMIVRA